ncbi:hypothetical protein [Spongiactinospora sp. TRM90649]|uniref:hypothetical protein n=1 Tax=Spongiactinospora sp. TRM90649 TaxID=3031114 RepID=UPI0023F72655|nr:hypothetical protein [Spongiactinospora sp. TRM90649]MDF5753032.1 hypothetical protein [Spongiactinospora sp. TRM90649]
MTAREPYTYVTVSLREGGETDVSVSFLTPDISVRALVIDDARPYLSLSTTEANVSISTSGGGQVSAHDVALAREIADNATRYLADCERLHIQAPPCDEAA